MQDRTAQLIGCTMKSLIPCRIQNKITRVRIGGNVIANPRRKILVAETWFGAGVDGDDESLG